MSRRIIILTSVLASIVVGTASADKLVLPLSARSLTTQMVEGSDVVDHYVLQIPTLSVLSGRRIVAAFLEFHANVTARPETLQVVGPDSVSLDTYVYEDEEPVLEIYALSAEYGGSIDLESLRERPVSFQGVRPGADRLIRVDVAPLLTSFVTSPSLNHGLVLGSLSGRRTGIFEITSVPADGGRTVATLTIHYE